MARTSLRADSACGNVVALPNAAPRKVHNKPAAIRAFREANPWPGHYELPAHRDAAFLAQDLSAAEIMLRELIALLPSEQREMLVSRLDRFAFLSHAPAAMRGAIIAATGNGLGMRLAERGK